MMAVYSRFAPDFIKAGLPVFPVDTREKRPAVKGWRNTTPRHARAWADIPADGIGLLMGERSGITEVDVDAAGDAWIGAALDRFGDTPVVIRTASGKGKLWYRHNGEGRQIRPFKGEPIDILGNGFTIAPPSWRDDLGDAYAFLAGGLDDLGRLPVMRDAQAGFTRAPEGVLRGERDVSLWRYCMAQARHCDDVETLIDVAVTWTSAMPEPLSYHDAEGRARSAWKYETSGRNFLGMKRPLVTDADKTLGALLDAPDAFTLLSMFRMWHRGRDAFVIAPRAMSEAGSPPWRYSRIAMARDVLLERGLLIEVRAPERMRHPGLYRLAA